MRNRNHNMNPKSQVKGFWGSFGFANQSSLYILSSAVPYWETV